jgi:chromosome segregation ATPase
MEVAMSPESGNAVRERLEARLRAINEEIQQYPQPIARCDAQLGGLLEERLKIREQLEALDRDARR